jgi:hypothetical protein
MDGHSILQGDYPQLSTHKLRYFAPESVSIPLLRLGTERFLDDGDAPLLSQIGTLAKNLILEIVREAILDHRIQDTSV